MSAEPPASGCGSIPTAAPDDPDGIFASLPKAQQDALNRWPKIRKSAWAGWKPSGPPPYDVGIVAAGGVDQLQLIIFKELQRLLEASPLIGEVNFLSTGKSLDVPLQLQLISQTVQRKPDLIIAEPIQPAAFESIQTKAGKAGIPTVNFLGAVDTPYSLNVDNNSYLGGAVVASGLIRATGAKGEVLFVHGYPGVTSDDGAIAGLKTVLKGCPNAKLGGEIIGGYSNSAAKSETLKYLATHPSPPAAVIHAGGMGTGVVQAFTSSGRKPSALGDIGPVRGSLAYWRKTPEHRAIGFGQPAKWTAEAVVSVALRTLQGQGPRINTILSPLPLITAENLEQWVPEGLEVTDEIPAEGPRDAFLSEDYLNGLFERGRKP